MLKEILDEILTVEKEAEQIRQSCEGAVKAIERSCAEELAALKKEFSARKNEFARKSAEDAEKAAQDDGFSALKDAGEEAARLVKSAGKNLAAAADVIVEYLKKMSTE